jgi:hypothetical protein
MSTLAHEFVTRPQGLRKQYDNFIGGQRLKPMKGRYFIDFSPMNQTPFAEVASSDVEDVELALDAAHKAHEKWSDWTNAAEKRPFGGLKGLPCLNALSSQQGEGA